MYVFPVHVYIRGLLAPIYLLNIDSYRFNRQARLVDSIY